MRRVPEILEDVSGDPDGGDFARNCFGMFFGMFRKQCGMFFGLHLQRFCNVFRRCHCCPSALSVIEEEAEPRSGGAKEN